MVLSQMNRRQHLPTDSAGVLFRNALEKEENVLKMTDAAATMDLSEEMRRALELFSVAIRSVCFKYDADFRDSEELHKAGT